VNDFYFIKIIETKVSDRSKNIMFSR